MVIKASYFTPEISSHPFDSTFSPLCHLAVAHIDGSVSLFDFTIKSLLWNIQLHDESCTSLDFNWDGNGLYTTSSDGSLFLTDSETGKVIMRKKKAHSKAINKVHSLTESLVATGDDLGRVKIWDIRQRKLALKFHENTDYITDFAFKENTLLATGGDGCLSVFDVRKKKPVKVSDSQDDELLSVCIVKSGTKAVVGTSSGTVLLFSWNNWGDCTDRFPGHPMPVNAVQNTDDGLVYTGCGDGLIRVISILPNELVATIGGVEGESIETMKLSDNGKWLSTTSDTVKVWQAGIDSAVDGDEETETSVINNQVENDFSSDNDSQQGIDKSRKKQKTKKTFIYNSAKDFFKDLD